MSTARTIRIVLMLLAVAVGLLGHVALAAQATCYCVSAPAGASACPGDTVAFSVTADGQGPLTYQWYHGSTPLQDGKRVSGATTDRLEVRTINDGDAGDYRIVVTGSGGGVTSDVATLTVKAPTVITTQPASASVCPGEPASFSVVATGEGTLTYRWSHDGTPVTDGGTVSGATSAKLVVSNAQKADAGTYTVTVSGGCGAVTSSAATLTVKAPTVITTQPASASVCPGETASFSVVATGEGPLTYQWSHGGTPLTNSGNTSGATSAKLVISNAQDADAGTYTVMVTGGCGAVTSSAATLTVKAPTVITTQPASVSVCPGDTASFSVVATGEGTLTYRWSRDGTPLTNGGNTSGATSAKLMISNARDADAGTYTVTVTGACGALTSSTATLAVKAPTVIGTQPASTVTCTGTTASFSVVATGEAPLSYQWSQDGTPLTNDGDISGATSPRLVIADVQNADAGTYTVTVAGECGSVVSSGATLTLKTPTVITSEPVRVSAYTETTVGFSVTATGEDLTYQWYHGSTALEDGDRISGATTPELRISDVQTGDSGDYSVVVTGGCGSATSGTATLEARPAIGTLQLVSEGGPKDILIVQDLSSSMNDQVPGGSKIVVAKSVLEDLLTKLSKRTVVALRTFHSCGVSDLEVPFQAISTGVIIDAVTALRTWGTTPLAYALRQVADDLQGRPGPHIVLLITDGIETCNEDPVAAARDLAASSDRLVFFLVGFGIKSIGAEAGNKLQAIADAAHGIYVDAESADELLSNVLGLVLPPSYHVYNDAGQVVKEGILGDGSFQLPAGTYSIVVDTKPKQELKNVRIEADKSVTITVKLP